MRLLNFATAKIKGRIDVYLLLVLVAGLLLALPVIIHDFPRNGHDSAIHILWYRQFSAQLWAGELYPRWLMDMNGGLGSPALFYYPPVTYYLTSLLKPFFNQEIFGWQQLGWSATVALCGSGACGYAWLKRATNQPKAAFGGAVLYMAMPYHLALDLYLRAALAEFWAFVWMPVILYFVHDVNSHRRVAFIGISAGYALLIGTHPPATLMFFLIPLGYAYAVAERDRRASALALTTGAMALAVCLCAVYLLPALFMQRFVAIQEMISDYRPHFLFTNLELFDLERIVPWAVWTTVGLAACAFLTARFYTRGEETRRVNRLWAAVAAVSLLMMLPLSRPIWWLLPPLHRLQFPWRFTMILCVAASALAASAMASLKRPLSIRAKIIVAIAFVLVMSWVPLTYVLARNAYPIFHFIEEHTAFTELRLNQRRDAPEYGPVWAPRFAEEKFDSLLQSVGKTGGGTMPVIVVEGAGETVIEHWQPRDIRLRVKSPDGVTLHIGQFYYVGWTGKLNDEANQLAVRPARHTGVLRVEVPRGQHRVRLLLERRWPEAVGQFVSLFSAMVAVIAVAYFSRRRAPRFGSLSSNTTWLHLVAIRETLINKMLSLRRRKHAGLIAALIFIFSFFVFWLSPAGHTFQQRVWGWLRPQFLAESQRNAPSSFSFIQGRIDVSEPAADEHLWYGWSGREEGFRWTDGSEAAITFALEDIENVRLHLMLSPFLVPEKVIQQRVNLRLNGHAVAAFALREHGLREFQFDLPREMLTRENVLTFDLPDAASPAAYGLGNDTRQLAVAAYWLEIESPALREALRNPQRRTATNSPLLDTAFRTELSIIDAPRTLSAGEQVTIRVRVRNESGTLWPALGRSDNQFQVRLGNRWLDADEIIVSDDGRSPLPYDLPPGSEVEIPLIIKAPAAAGAYFLEVDMLQEGVSWFDSEASPAVRAGVTVR